MRRWICALRSLTMFVLLGVVLGPAAQEISASSASSPATFWERHIWSEPDRGFLFYEPEEKKRAAPQPQAQRQRPRNLADITDHDELKKEREQRLKIAIMQPTPENMRLYLEANTFMMQKSAMFSDMWRRTVWQSPEFDFNVHNPNANFAQASIRNDRQERKRQVVQDISRDYGVLFFARSDCPYCRLQAPVLAELRRQYGIDVMAVSLDGRPVEGFPDAKPDNGISMRVSSGQGITAVPALFLVARNSPHAVMLGAGVLALDEIVERINVLTQLQPGTDIAGGVR